MAGDSGDTWLLKVQMSYGGQWVSVGPTALGMLGCGPSYGVGEINLCLLQSDCNSSLKLGNCHRFIYKQSLGFILKKKKIEV